MGHVKERERERKKKMHIGIKNKIREIKIIQKKQIRNHYKLRRQTFFFFLLPIKCPKRGASELLAVVSVVF